MKWKDELALAIDAATTAGALLVEWAASEKAVLSDAGRDVKLQADRDAEAAILEILQRGPHPVLAEESGENGEWEGDAPFWVVDPLDGTANYFRGIPSCAVSIGLCCGDRAVLGVILDFNRNELFEGVVGEGARLNGAPMHVATVSDPKQGFLGTGFPVNLDLNNDASLRRVMSLMRQYKKVRMTGSAAITLANVASGRFDAYIEENMFLWDIAAGLALIEAAGGVVHVRKSGDKPWMRRAICGSCPEIIEPLMKMEA